ncbi:MAG: hypothetical protein ACXW2P_02090 [Thermoanaerobaculia bacterium]
MAQRLIDEEGVSGGMILTRGILGTIAVLLLIASNSEAPVIDPAAFLAELVRLFMSF